MALNTSGNYKGGKELVKYSKVEAFKSKVRTTGTKVSTKAARSFAKYGKPSVTLGKRLLKWGVVKPVKLALRFPGVGLATTAAYYTAKHIGTKAGAKKFKYPEFREFDKRGRKIT
jgi:hypothetical protein